MPTYDEARFFVLSVIIRALETQVGKDTICGFSIHNTTIAVPKKFIPSKARAWLDYSNIAGDGRRVCFLMPNPEQDDIHSIEDHRYFAQILCHEGAHLGQHVNPAFSLSLEEPRDSFLAKQLQKEVEAVTTELLDYLLRVQSGTLGYSNNYINQIAAVIAPDIHSIDAYQVISENSARIAELYKETAACEKQMQGYADYYNHRHEGTAIHYDGFQSIDRHEFTINEFVDVSKFIDGSMKAKES